MIGTAEADLDDSERIGRRGNEQLPLTWTPGSDGSPTSSTITGTGVFRVVAVQVELPSGAQTVTR
jgi:hypothetical protein